MSQQVNSFPPAHPYVGKTLRVELYGRLAVDEKRGVCTGTVQYQSIFEPEYFLVTVPEISKSSWIPFSILEKLFTEDTSETLTFPMVKTLELYYSHGDHNRVESDYAARVAPRVKSEYV